MKTVLIALLLVMSSSASAQINYVLNPDFEIHTGCPDNNDEINLATHWSAIDSVGPPTISCIPDYCHSCANGIDTLNSVPSSVSYWQYPHSGRGMVQINMFNDEANSRDLDLRNYLQGRLSKKLTAGKRYCVSFYVNLEEGSAYAAREISAYLDNGSIDTTQNYCSPLTRYTPQVTNAGGVITDTMRWTKIEGSFVANGSEQFITIGNFKDKAHTTYVRVPDNKYNNISLTGHDCAFYLIDDVSVVESDLKADAGPDRHVGYGDSVYIGRPKEVGLECTWTKLGSSVVVGTGAGIWVRPTVTTRYVVTQTLCGAVQKDTVEVQVWAAGVTSVNDKTQEYGLAPNPNDGNIQLQQAMEDKAPVSVMVCNTLGAVVYKATASFERNAAGLQLSSLAPGMYYLILHDSHGGAYNLRFVKR